MLKLFKKIACTFLIITCPAFLFSQKIDRKVLVQGHNVAITKIDSLSSLSVGNGNFAFTVDATGLQSFPEAYSKVVLLGTQSVGGRHSYANTEKMKIEEAQKYNLKMMPGAVTDFFEKTNDTLSFSTSTRNLADYGNILMNLKNVFPCNFLYKLMFKKKYFVIHICVY